MSTRKKLGSEEPIRLDSFLERDTLPEYMKDTVLVAKHIGLDKQREWLFELDALRYAELKRLKIEREGLTPELAPKFWPELEKNADGSAKPVGLIFVTQGGVLAFGALAKKICLEGMVRLESYDGETLVGQAAIDELAAHGICEPCMKVITEVQAPTKAQRFPVAGTGQAKV